MATPDRATTPSAEIPQFVVIRDLVHNTYKHPTIHYVFEDEPFPDVPRDKLIVVDLDQNAQFSSAESYSPHFQVTDCRLEQSTISDQLDDRGGTGLLTVEGVSAPRANEAIESLQPIRNLDNLRETIYNFKIRNEMVKNAFSGNTPSSSPPPLPTSSPSASMGN